MPWKFQARVNLPDDFSSAEYCVLIARATVAFSDARVKQSLSSFSNISAISPRSVIHDMVLAACTPGPSPLLLRLAAFVVRRALGWTQVTIKLDAASLVSVADLSHSLVLCPTHRSVLDFVVLGALSFQLRPQLPMLSVPHVAADAEFRSLPFLGRVLARLGAFFVRRGGGGVQPDPFLRAELGRVFQNGHPLEVFLEGARSRGRRFLRLRTGFLRVLSEIAQRPVALVPVAMSYELLPEDASFFEEMHGSPRPPLRTSDLLCWVARAIRGELPPLGQVHVRLGSASIMDTSADVPALLCNIQSQLVSLSVLTSLHVRALAEVLKRDVSEVMKAYSEAGIHVHDTNIERTCTEAERWALAFQAIAHLSRWLPPAWASWFIEPLQSAHSTASPVVESPAADRTALQAVVAALLTKFDAAETAAKEAVKAICHGGATEVLEAHLLQQLLQTSSSVDSAFPSPLAFGAARIVAAAQPNSAPDRSASKQTCLTTSGKGGQVSYTPLWPSDHRQETRCDEEAINRWGFVDTSFVAQWCDGRAAVKMTSKRYAICGRPLFELWSLFQRELRVPLSVRGTNQVAKLPDLPPPAAGLEEALASAIPRERFRCDAEARLRGGTGQGLADIWLLRSGTSKRMPDAVVRPESEDEVRAVLECAATHNFAVIPVGGRTNVTSATRCPSVEVDPRPFVALDMRGLKEVLWVNHEDRVAMVQAGITGVSLKESLRKHGVTMGMEPDSMELSTLGGWIATRASGMKRTRYGNIEEMVVEVRIVTPSGIFWQNHNSASAAHGNTAFGRTSVNVGLPGMMLGSEGCLGIVVAAIVRIRSLPKVVQYQSVVFPDWARGAAWMREVARLPVGFRPASCRLMDSKQLALAGAMKEESEAAGVRKFLKSLALRMKGVHLDVASAATIVFEGDPEEVAIQKRSISQLVSRSGGLWGGSSAGEAGYELTFAIAYLRDFGLDHHILSESFETFVPWSAIHTVWPAVTEAVEREHRALKLPGKPFLSHRLTQLYDEGGALYMYLAASTCGMEAASALHAFERLEEVARRATLDAGGSLSHHHGVGKIRAPYMREVQSQPFGSALKGLKAAVDPSNVLAAGNGVWASQSAMASAHEAACADVCAPSSVPKFLSHGDHAVEAMDHASDKKHVSTLENDMPVTPSKVGEQTHDLCSEGTAKRNAKSQHLDERRAFEAAADRVNERATAGLVLSEDLQLRLYALYKQAVSGDAPLNGPWALAVRAKRKWEAWSSVRNMSREEAMRQYVKLAEMVAR
eukprot:TRINITY_DN30143_c0_g2_i1.p1 TRINITY_DN30143_c0_g2~~TRINITY_DN30143_c0_g2_i1.p1  ORF type:complete len:1310 (+),score=180.00 TRINITY_DN30143_c0_g2_i1:131-3931(+)